MSQSEDYHGLRITGYIAEAILLLATNPYMTGTTVTVDGGGTIG